MIFFDFEVFMFDWMVVLKDPSNRQTTEIHNNPDAFIEFYKEHSDDVWTGYNSKHYDTPIHHGITSKLSPSMLYSLSNDIINSGQSMYQLLKRYNVTENRNFYTYDTMLNDGKKRSLKQLEGFMGSNIEECSIPWDIRRELTPEEIKEVFIYCNHDVEETMKVWLETKTSYDAMMQLIKTFNLPLSNIGRSEAQIAAYVLGATKRTHYDEMDITIIDTLNINKYKEVVDFYRNGWDYSNTLTIDVANVKHIFGSGGIHGAVPNYIDDGYYVMSDITSMHPAIMIEYNFLSRNIKNPKKYRTIRDDRVVMKKAKNPGQLAYKLVLNATNGAAKDKYNPLYDPRQNNNVCVTAQLVLLDLIEQVEPLIESLIQSNTDGILVKLKSKADYDAYIAICDAWEDRTRLQLEHDIYVKVIQKDVNNYILVPGGELYYPNGNPRFKSKGAYVKPLSNIDNDLAILNDALINYFIHGTPVEDTINNCTKLKRFQKIVKRGHMYKTGSHNGKLVDTKVNRVFASNKMTDGTLYWTNGNKYTKVGSTPEHCFIDNSDVNRKRIPRRLDKQWYIDQAHKRVSDFIGMNNHKQQRLF